MRGFPIGRLFGIELRVDWSWVLILGLMVWSLVAVLGDWHADWQPHSVLGLAVAASLLFFVCVVLHELAHALVARKYGMRVRSVTFFLFGGTSDIEREPPSPKAEVLTAIAGPATSIGLGVAFSVIAALTTLRAAGLDEGWAALAALDATPTLLVWLGAINLAIGLFNLLPAFPLDGGRVFRAALWAASGNLRRATTGATAVGGAIGWALFFTGVAMSFGAHVPLLGTGLVGGLWLAFIGWFIHGAAVQASGRVALDEALAGMTVEQMMRRDPPVVPPQTPVSAFVYEYLLPSGEHACPVLDRSLLVGLVSISDIRIVPRTQWGATRVGEVMRIRHDLEVTAPDEPLSKAFERLAELDVEQLPVVEDGRLVGLLRRADVARFIELAWRPSRPRAAAPPKAPVRGYALFERSEV